MKALLSFVVIGVLSAACARFPDKALSAGPTQTQRGPSAVTSPPRPEGAACGESLGPSPFKNPNSAHVLVADFFESRKEEPEFGDDVTQRLDLELKRFRDEKPGGKVPVAVSNDTVEFARLRCFMTSHEHAEVVAQAWGADLVLWGKAYCDTRLDVQQGINVPPAASRGRVTATEQGKANVNRVEARDKQPYTVCPSATLPPPETSSRRTDTSKHSLASLDHRLNLPALSSSAPSQLVYFTIGLSFWERNQPAIAALFFEKSISHVLSSKEENLAPLHMYLGRALLELPGGARHAIAFSQEALREFSGTGTPTEAVLLINIGSALQTEEKSSEAEPFFRRALAVYEKALGKDHPNTARALNYVGSTLLEQGKASEAEGFFRRALAIHEKASGKDRPDAGPVLNNIGTALQSQGKASEAEAFFRRAVAVYERNSMEDHPNAAATLSNMGFSLLAQGKASEAEGFFRRALAVYEKNLGKDHLEAATVLNNIGSTLQEQGKVSEAEGFFRRALAVYEKNLGKDHLEAATVLNNIGFALQAQGKAPEAEGFFRRVLAIYEKALGKDHPQTAAALTNLGTALQAQGKTSEAEGFFRRALPVYEKALGQDHPLTRRLARSLELLHQSSANRAR
ncbi:MAG TPA: tetratricopeptide repeat protein [Polyangiaceae bacterium]|nr:tetratricopeptide repeat protein [Polyangiaceae bacterium]